MSSAVWHPFTQEALAPEPIKILSGKGAKLYTEDGRVILDAVSSWWVNIHGHSEVKIAEAIYTQATELEHVIFAGFTHAPAIQLAESLLRICPGSFNKVFYSDNGSTAVEVAIKMALQFHYNLGHDKKKIIALEGAYHGDTFGAMSVGGRSAFNGPFADKLFDVDFIPVPNESNFESVLNLFQSYLEKGDVAAFIFEPLLQGTAGMKMYKAEYLDSLIRSAKQHGVLCIADEVMTGFGRTGHLFACEYINETADVMCLSKGITGGFMPLGVTLCTSKIYQAFHSSDRMKTFFHGHSYTGNPLSCAAANASLELLLSKERQHDITRVSAFMSRFCEELKTIHSVSSPRNIGTVLAFELESDNNNYFSGIRDKIYDYAIQNGVLLRPLGNTVYLMPPYVISDDELENIRTVVLKMIKYIHDGE
ncbi:MAG TPA: adenosylmethionine--8-amino-7-oxononanoate transaminase [Bacteroidia bacterium]